MSKCIDAFAEHWWKMTSILKNLSTLAPVQPGIFLPLDHTPEQFPLVLHPGLESKGSMVPLKLMVQGCFFLN